MEATKGFLADFINKKLKTQRVSAQRGDTGEPVDFMAAARYRTTLFCLMKNSRQDLRDIIRLSPPHMSEKEATEEFLKNVSLIADEFADDFTKAVEALARIVLWNDNKCLDRFPEQFIPELDTAIKEIFPDSGLWGNIAWDAIVKKTEGFLAANYHDTVTLAVYSRAVSILIDHENKIARMFFESFRNDVVKAIVLNIIQPMADTLSNEARIEENQRSMLLNSLYLLQSSLLAA
jgi:hypothetical protein